MIIFAQAFVDALMGVGLIIAGSSRIIILLTGCYRRSRRSCLLKPWSPIIMWSEIMSATSTLMISTDRLISCLAPMRYFMNSYSYQVRQITVFFGSISLFIFISWIFSFLDNESLLQGFCWTGDVFYPFFADLHSLLLISTASLSVALYVIVYLLSRKHLRRIKNNQSEESLQLFEARQRKLTITMGISCVFTLFFFVIPLCIKLLIYDDDNDPTTYYSESLRVTVALSCNINPITNVAAILIKQNDISHRIRGLLPKRIIYGTRKN
ncbi:unnamed protein product [Litomosoides sigmodontis]|uniref:G-protein coupled receptors family 1 profile domain-containing protein n=1 Tax=Litomosoides sigmodontis TaxID=42156 RepID=A0A3P6VAM8_LITSI|nr:unnamed protein product [Litomosoides sigmodontis]